MSDKRIKSITPIRGGGIIMAFDYAALEVRGFVNIAREYDLGAIIQSGVDMHSAIAQKIFPELKDVDLKTIKSEHKKLRQYAKSATFGTLYGSGPGNLAQQLDIPIAQATDIIDGLMGAFKGLQTYVENCHNEAKTKGFKDTYFGYRRQLDHVIMEYPDLDTAAKNKMGKRYKHALNASQNHEVQSTASIIGWICASHIQEEILLQGLKSRMIGNVHDSVEIEVYPGEMQELLRIIQHHADDIPNTIYPFMDIVKLKFDVELGESWSGTAGECHNITYNEDGTTTITWEGGNLWWDYLYKQLQLGYDIEVLEIKEIRDYEQDNDCPLPQPTKDVEVTFKINNKATITEFKSKYYVGNGKLDSKIEVPPLE